MKEVNVKKFDVVDLEKVAVESYTGGVPLTVTAVRHATKEDDSEFHCIWMGAAYDIVQGRQSGEGRPYCIKKVFTVPKQSAELCKDEMFGLFYAILVIPQFEVRLYDEKEFYLIAQVSGESGFLVTVEEFVSRTERKGSMHAVAA